MSRFIGRIEQLVALLHSMQEVDFAKAFEVDVISLRAL